MSRRVNVGNQTSVTGIFYNVTTEVWTESAYVWLGNGLLCVSHYETEYPVHVLSFWK